MVLRQGRYFCGPGDLWQGLETFSVALMEVSWGPGAQVESAALQSPQSLADAGQDWLCWHWDPSSFLPVSPLAVDSSQSIPLLYLEAQNLSGFTDSQLERNLPG